MYQEQDSHYVLNVGNDHDFSARYVTESSDGGMPSSRQGTEEEDDDDDLLKEDINNWDIFDDCHKF